MEISEFTVGDYSFSLKTTSNVMNPSPYTKFLGDYLLDMDIPEICIDVGCGSGALSILLAKLGAEKVYAIDSNGDALDVTEENAVRHDVGAVIEVEEKDLFKGLQQETEVDLVISNPPSLPMLERPDDKIDQYNYYGGSDGNMFIENLISETNDILADNGDLVFINTSLANPAETLVELVSEGYSDIHIDYTTLKFRDTYDPYISFLEKLDDDNVAHFLSEKGKNFEILFLIKANI